MLVTMSPVYANPSPRRAAAPAAPAQPDRVTLSSPPSPATRRAVGAVTGAVAGAGFGWLGLQAGGRAGLMLGMLATSPQAGLGALMLNSMRGIAFGELAGALTFGAAGAAAGAIGASALYDHYHG